MYLNCDTVKSAEIRDILLLPNHYAGYHPEEKGWQSRLAQRSPAGGDDTCVPDAASLVSSSASPSLDRTP
jgi:hypothetical protein